MIKASINLKGVDEFLRRLTQYFDTGLRKALEEFAEELRKETKQRFFTKTDPEGNAWKPLAPSTVKRKGHSSQLIETGNLLRSINTEVEDGEVRIGTNVFYGRFQEEGTVRIPKRSYLGVTKSTVEKFAKRIKNDMEKLK